jgi:hypothetical protein
MVLLSIQALVCLICYILPSVTQLNPIVNYSGEVQQIPVIPT